MTPFEAMEENLRAMLAVFARAKASAETRGYPGVAVTYSGVQFSMFNSAILTAPVRSGRELDQRIKAAATHFAARRSPWSLWLCESWLDKPVRSQAGEISSRNGLHLVVELPGMEAERIAPPERELPRLEYRRVVDDPTRSDFNHIMSVAFGIPFAISREVYEAEKTWRGDFEGHVAYAGGAPVATAATLAAGGVVGVYAVGTLPSQQRKGYGEAVMRHTLEQVRQASGFEHTVLQSSEAGFRLYQKMGYRTIARYAVFAYS